MPSPIRALLSSPVSRAAVLVALEGVALVVLGVVYAVAGLRGDAESRVGAAMGALLIAASGALLLLVARGLHRRRGWARSPAVAVQLLAFLTGLSLAPTGVAPAAFLTMAVAATVLYSLFSGPARGELERPSQPGCARLLLDEQALAQLRQGAGEQARDVHLADPELGGDLRLRHAAEEAQHQDLLLAGRQPLEQRLERLAVLDPLERLVHGAERVGDGRRVVVAAVPVLLLAGTVLFLLFTTEARLAFRED